MAEEEYKIIDEIKFENFIGPWVLPNEEIPAHLIWDKDFDFNSIDIQFTEGLEFIEAINIKNYSSEENHIYFLKENINFLGKSDSFPNFFGLVFMYKSLNFDGLKLFKDINIRFLKNSTLLKEINLTSKIFRPRLRDISNIESITLVDDRDDYIMDINLIYEGFGFIATRLEVEINESIIPFDQSIFEKVIENLENRYSQIFDIFSSENNDSSHLYESIDEGSVNKFIKLLENFNYDAEVREKDIGVIFKENKIENIFISDFYMELIKELRFRYKHENVIIKNPNVKIPCEKFEEIIHSSNIFIYYKDLNENIYEPLNICLNLKDRRSDFKDACINFHINIKKITDNRFKDIEKERRT